MLESGNPAIFASGVSVNHSPNPHRDPWCVCKVLGPVSLWTQPPCEAGFRES